MHIPKLPPDLIDHGRNHYNITLSIRVFLSSSTPILQINPQHELDAWQGITAAAATATALKDVDSRSSKADKTRRMT